MKRESKLKRVLRVVLTWVMILSILLPSFGSPVYAATGQGNNKNKLAVSNTYDITVDETLNLTASGDKVDWKSSNKKVATVSKSGVVTGKSEGTATITVTVTNKIKVKPAKTFFGKLFQAFMPKVTKTYTKYVIHVQAKPIKDPIEPIGPEDPVEPIDPEDPVEPVDPVDPVDPIDPVDPVEPVDPVVATITLSTGKSEFEPSGTDTAYFYAKVTAEVSNIVLVDADSKEILIEMVDDGKYAGSGDDLPGDGVYSAKLTINTSAEKKYHYYAADKNNSELTSNTVEIRVVEGFSDQQLQNMDQVDDTIQNELFNQAAFDTMSMEEKQTTTSELLNTLTEQELIQTNSVLYDEETETYTFMYSSGVLGAVILQDWNSEQNGMMNSETDPEWAESADEENGADAMSEEELQNAIEMREEMNEQAELASNSAALYTNTAEEQPATIGKAIVLWAFNQAWDDDGFRRPFYQQLEKDWDALGLETTVNYEPTVNDYKNLKGNDIIVFSSHGAYQKYSQGFLGLNNTTVSSILLHEECTKERDSAYSADLKELRVGKASITGGTFYAILPTYFKHYYSDGDLDTSLVFSECCEFYGKNGNEDHSMGNNLLEGSAKSVIGFHNSVMANYSRNMMKYYVEQLIDGKNSGEAFDEAKSKYGNNDYFTGRELYGPTAYPIFSGNREATLISEGIKNGDFEFSNTLSNWGKIGDVRGISKLGSLSAPQNQKMAILTTGIGSAEEEYLSGTEGSVLYQTIQVPADKTTLTFTYDYVSEEPLEYVKSGFNDTFVVQVVSGSNVTTLETANIDDSVWYEIGGIDFDGGDSTTYHTNWKTVNCNLSAYAGKVVTIRFMVYDVGDSIYDSAVLLDAVGMH